MSKTIEAKDERLDALSKALEPDERMIVYLYFGFRTREKLSLDQVAKFMGMSRTKATKIKEIAIEKLKNNPIVKEYFEDFLKDEDN